MKATMKQEKVSTKSAQCVKAVVGSLAPRMKLNGGQTTEAKMLKRMSLYVVSVCTQTNSGNQADIHSYSNVY